MRMRPVPSSVVTLFLLAAVAAPAAAELSLTDAVRQALESNLDLLARRRALEADREEIGIARSALLPQIGIGARAQLLDSDRSDSARGNNRQGSVLVAAGLQQVLYDESYWASFQIQKQVYAEQVQELESFRLGVVQDAADAFLDLDRAQAVLGIQERNREVTRKNLETSRSRIAAGWSSDREILRWQSQLAGNDGDVRAAQVLVLQSRFSLNRVRNRPPEDAASPLPVSVAEYGFVYARDAIVQAIAAPDEDRRMRDFLVRVGLGRSPELAALDASIAAAERQLTASRRAFWVPSLGVAAGIDHQAVSSSGSAGGDFNATEWGAKGVFTFPLLRGGAKFYELRQSGDLLASLRTERSAASLSLEQTIRAVFAQASGSYADIDFARRQLEAASRNFELVDASYVLGVASILDLLDAQNLLLTAELGVTNALYGFLEDLVAAERETAFYPFLEPAAEVEALVDGLERALGLTP